MKAIDLNENYKAVEELAEEIYGEMRLAKFNLRLSTFKQ
jgi:RNase P/RNase MRP subunit POP5